jgi:hypothetical protein
MLEQPAEVQPTTNDYGADVASSSLQVCFWAQKTIGNNSCCERNQYRNFVKLAKIKIPKWNAEDIKSLLKIIFSARRQKQAAENELESF